MIPIDLKPNILTTEATLHQVIARLDAARRKLIMVVDPDGRLCGTATDGDVRRALLRMTPMDAPVAQVMNPAPITLGPDRSARESRRRLVELGLSLAPVVDAEGRVIGLYPDAPDATVEHDNLVVIMAGGRGARLAPLTHRCPKPMLQVAGRPILETIISRFKAQGFRRFRLSINYLGEMIEGHFGDGGALGVEIDYLRETEPRGTAGALSLLDEPVTAPMLVMNGDILTRLDFGQLVRFHQEHGAQATVSVRELRFEAPYGVVETDGHRLLSIQEKPTFRWFVSAGIYCLDPAALNRIPTEGHYDMPDLLGALAAEGEEVGAFPIHEYWIDIGRPPDFEQANTQFAGAFDGDEL